MIDNSTENIKKENKKAFKGFVRVIIIGGIGGGVIGFLSRFISQIGIMSVSEAVKSALFTITPFMLPGIFIICGALILYYYRKAKAIYGSWDGEDEYSVNDAEMNISKAMLATTIALIIGLFFMGAQIFNLMQGMHYNEPPWLNTLIILLYVVLLLFFVFCQKKIVDLTRIMNPEKKGSVYDIKFQDIWLESCDEAERMKIYQSAYASYKFMNVFLVVLWAITMFTALCFETGLLAMTLVSISWLALNLSYMLKSMKLERLK